MRAITFYTAVHQQLIFSFELIPHSAYANVYGCVKKTKDDGTVIFFWGQGGSYDQWTTDDVGGVKERGEQRYYYHPGLPFIAINNTHHTLPHTRQSTAGQGGKGTLGVATNQLANRKLM